MLPNAASRPRQASRKRPDSRVRARRISKSAGAQRRSASEKLTSKPRATKTRNSRRCVKITSPIVEKEYDSCLPNYHQEVKLTLQRAPGRILAHVYRLRLGERTAVCQALPQWLGRCGPAVTRLGAGGTKSAREYDAEAALLFALHRRVVGAVGTESRTARLAGIWKVVVFLSAGSNDRKRCAAGRAR
jgi:hypothetical protein